MKRLPLTVLCLCLAATPSQAIDCNTVPGNVMPNCDFDDGVTGWSVPVGGGLAATAGGENGTVGARWNGDAQTGLGQLWSPCVLVQPGTSILVGIAATNDGPASFPTCEVGVQEFADAACTDTLIGLAASGPTVVGDGTFHTLQGNHVVDANAASAVVTLTCSQQPPVGFELRVDNGFLAIQPDVVEVPMSRPGLLLVAAALALAGLWALRVG